MKENVIKFECKTYACNGRFFEVTRITKKFVWAKMNFMNFDTNEVEERTIRCKKEVKYGMEWIYVPTWENSYEIGVNAL